MKNIITRATVVLLLAVCMVPCAISQKSDSAASLALENISQSLVRIQNQSKLDEILKLSIFT